MLIKCNIINSVNSIYIKDVISLMKGVYISLQSIRRGGKGRGRKLTLKNDWGARFLSVIEVSVTPGSLFQRRNYGLDRRLLQTSGCEKGNLKITRGVDTHRVQCTAQRTRDVSNAETRAAVNRRAAISLRSRISRFPGTERTGTCLKYRGTCRLLLKIDSSLCVAFACVILARTSIH